MVIYLCFEKRLIDSKVTELLFNKTEWDEVLQNNTYNNIPIDIIQIVHCQDNHYILEYVPIIETLPPENKSPICAIEMEHITKKDCKLLDGNQVIKILGKRDKPKVQLPPKNTIPIGTYPEIMPDNVIVEIPVEPVERSSINNDS